MPPFFKALIPLMLLILNLVGPPAAQAAVVGHFTEVVGRVDLMKGGQLPTIEVKLKDPVEIGDLVRSKSESKAQITFIDATTINIAPDTTPVIPPPPPPPPPAPPPPSLGTYTFQQIAQSKWQTTADPSGQSNTLTSTGWAQRTGSWPAGTFPEYYTSSSTGSRTVLEGASLASSTGVSSTTLTGSVTGVLGSTLTGTATLTGMGSFGQTNSFTGTVSIDPSGQMTFT